MRCSIIIEHSSSTPLIFVPGKQEIRHVEANSITVDFTGSTWASLASIFVGTKKRHSISSMPLSSRTAMVSVIQLA